MTRLWDYLLGLAMGAFVLVCILAIEAYEWTRGLFRAPQRDEDESLR